MIINCTRIDLIVVGAASGAWSDLARDYEKRVGRYVRFDVREIKGEPLQRGPEAVMKAEGERLNAAIDALCASPDPSRLIVACDRGGKSLTSEMLAERLLGATHVVVLVGGAAGLDASVLARCNLKIAFGDATLPHQLARVLITEQIYRSFRIARGEPYHH